MVKGTLFYFFINFHPMGEPETSICGVTKGSQSRHSGLASPLDVLQMKASDSCKIQLITLLSMVKAGFFIERN